MVASANFRRRLIWTRQRRSTGSEITSTMLVEYHATNVWAGEALTEHIREDVQSSVYFQNRALPRHSARGNAGLLIKEDEISTASKFNAGWNTYEQWIHRKQDMR